MRIGWKVVSLASRLRLRGRQRGGGVARHAVSPRRARLRRRTGRHGGVAAAAGDPAGGRAAPARFILHPAWEQSIGYDSNVLGGPAPLGSWVLGTRPSLLLSSDWSRDALGLYVAADDRRDLDAPAQSRTDWTASLGGSLDIGRDRLTLAVAHIDGHEDRTELDALPTDQPVAVPGGRPARCPMRGCPAAGR